MSATAEELRGVDMGDRNRMDDTVAYEPNDSSAAGREDPMGSSDMSNSNASAQGQGRYSFGSGARPLEGYTIKRAIGRGGFGEVYYATSDSGEGSRTQADSGRNLDVERRGVVALYMNLKCSQLGWDASSGT